MLSVFPETWVRLNGPASCASVIKTVFIQSHPTGRTWPRLVCAALTLALTVEASRRGHGHCQGSGDGLTRIEATGRPPRTCTSMLISCQINVSLAWSPSALLQEGAPLKQVESLGLGLGLVRSPHSLGPTSQSSRSAGAGPVGCLTGWEMEFRWARSRGLGEACDGQEMVLCKFSCHPLGVQGPVVGAGAFISVCARALQPPSARLGWAPGFPEAAGALLPWPTLNSHPGPWEGPTSGSQGPWSSRCEQNRLIGQVGLIAEGPWPPPTGGAGGGQLLPSGQSLQRLARRGSGESQARGQVPVPPEACCLLVRKGLGRMFRRPWGLCPPWRAVLSGECPVPQGLQGWEPGCLGLPLSGPGFRVAGEDATALGAAVGAGGRAAGSAAAGKQWL